MPFSVEDWHRRFQQQARWTQSVRQYLISRHGRSGSCRVLEVGCGTGAVLPSFTAYAHFEVWGIDLNLSYLQAARHHEPSAHYANADALRLPFPAAAFDIVVCHFFLLWIAQPERAIEEMVRVAKPGGTVSALAEPDYGGRIDYPPPLDVLGRLQEEALFRQGADPRAGRKISGWFHVADLKDVETGLLGGQWSKPPSPEQQEMEWQVLKADLGETITPGKLEEFQKIDAQAWQSGERVLFVPTFYAIGKKP